MKTTHLASWNHMNKYLPLILAGVILNALAQLTLRQGCAVSAILASAWKTFCEWHLQSGLTPLS
jgi:hypothetical protein